MTIKEVAVYSAFYADLVDLHRALQNSPRLSAERGFIAQVQNLSIFY